MDAATSYQQNLKTFVEGGFNALEGRGIMAAAAERLANPHVELGILATFKPTPWISNRMAELAQQIHFNEGGVPRPEAP